MIYLTNKIEIKMIKLITGRKTRSSFWSKNKSNNGIQTRKKPEAILEAKLDAAYEAKTKAIQVTNKEVIM